MARDKRTLIRTCVSRFFIDSNCRFVNLSLESMDRAAHDFELRVIVSLDGGCALRFQLTNARLDRRLVDADDVVMFVLNTQRLRDSDYQVVLVHLRVALDGFVIDAL